MKGFWETYGDDLVELGLGIFLLVLFVVSGIAMRSSPVIPVAAIQQQNQPVLSGAAGVPANTTKVTGPQKQ